LSRAIIYLAATLLLQSCCLPSSVFLESSEKIKRAAFNRWCTWHYSTQGLPIICIAANNRELLPHIFTLIFFTKRQLFSVALAVLLSGKKKSPQQTRRLTGVLPFAVRTFLPYY
jgi:hypothetical protein